MSYNSHMEDLYLSFSTSDNSTDIESTDSASSSSLISSHSSMEELTNDDSMQNLKWNLSHDTYYTFACTNPKLVKANESHNIAHKNSSKLGRFRQSDGELSIVISMFNEESNDNNNNNLNSDNMIIHRGNNVSSRKSNNNTRLQRPVRRRAINIGTQPHKPYKAMKQRKRGNTHTHTMCHAFAVKAVQDLYYQKNHREDDELLSSLMNVKLKFK